MYQPSLLKGHNIVFAAILPGHCLCSNSEQRQVFIPIYQSFPLIMGQILQQKWTDMAYPSQCDNKLTVRHWQQL